jgi:dTDP-glucose pyrophosphorylase
VKTTDDLIVLSGDSIIEKDDLKKLLKSKYYGCLVKKVENPKKY